MKKGLAVVLVLFFGLYMFGCAKKEAGMEDSQVPMSIETISALNTASTTTEAGTAGAQAVPAQVSTSTSAAAGLEPLPPAGPYKPSAKEIQTALKNAGFYTGEADGKIGPKSKKAIEDFQKANNLQADGKVGSRTWALLGTYLNAQAVQATSVPAKKKR
jgi:peptidoglycan hydrolase-like protein with peptidoglycan-binding domain